MQAKTNQKRKAEFLMSPNEHRRAAFLLGQDTSNPKAAELAKHHEALAKHIQNRVSNGTARIVGS